MDFRTMSVAELAMGVRHRELSARELTEHALARIEALNPEINAFVAVDAERSLADADEVDRRAASGEDPGPLAGVPVGVKDLEDAIGFVTTYGSALHAGNPPAMGDSALVGRLRAAGCVVVGKTNTPELGHKGTTDNPTFGATANPWSTAHSPGGSSGGTAAAIAAGMVPLGTGSDGGGSIRIPSALCGLSGLKTSNGRVPIAGRQAPGSGILSVAGPMARRTRDVALALDAVVGPDERDMLSLPAPDRPFVTAVDDAAPPRRVIWSPTMGFATIDREVLAVCEAAVAALADAGTDVVELESVMSGDPIDDWLTMWVVARNKAQGLFMDTPEWERISPSLRPQVEAGASVSGADHARALDACYRYRAELADAMETAEADLVLCPTVAGQAPRLGEEGTIDGRAEVGWVQLTYGINLTRNPAGSVNAGYTAAGLPVGLQVVGRHLDDAGVLAAMAAIEAVVKDDRIAAIG